LAVHRSCQTTDCDADDAAKKRAKMLEMEAKKAAKAAKAAAAAPAASKKPKAEKEKVEEEVFVNTTPKGEKKGASIPNCQLGLS
jgi:valyl-tRNA synthetase